MNFPEIFFACVTPFLQIHLAILGDVCVRVRGCVCVCVRVHVCVRERQRERKIEVSVGMRLCGESCGCVLLCGETCECVLLCGESAVSYVSEYCYALLCVAVC